MEVLDNKPLGACRHFTCALQGRLRFSSGGGGDGDQERVEGVLSLGLGFREWDWKVGLGVGGWRLEVGILR